MAKKPPAAKDNASDSVAAFLKAAQAAAARPKPGGRRGRLAVVLDATMSREPTWDLACRIQAEMFETAADLGGLDVQLIFFRGFRECRASPWTCDPAALAKRMTGVVCRAGLTQIGRALRHVLKQAEADGVDAFVYVGDCFEEDVDAVCDVAGRLGLRGVKGFIFHEGGDPVAGRAFREIARLTGGAYHPFDRSSPDLLKALLGAAAAYAAGGRAALADYGARRGGAALALAKSLPAPKRGE